MKAMMIEKKMMLDAVGGSAECSILCHHRSGSNNEQRMQGMCNKRVSHLLSPLGARDVLLLSPPNQEQEATLLLSMKAKKPPAGSNSRCQIQKSEAEAEVAHVFTCPCLSPLPTSAIKSM